MAIFPHDIESFIMEIQTVIYSQTYIRIEGFVLIYIEFLHMIRLGPSFLRGVEVDYEYINAESNWHYAKQETPCILIHFHEYILDIPFKSSTIRGVFN